MARLSLGLLVVGLLASLATDVSGRTIRNERSPLRRRQNDAVFADTAPVMGIGGTIQAFDATKVEAKRMVRSNKFKRQDVNTLDAALPSMGQGGEVIPFDAAKVERRRRNLDRSQRSVVPSPKAKRQCATTKRSIPAKSSKAKRQDINTLDAAEASMGIGGEVVPFDSAQVERRSAQTHQKRQDVNTLDAAEASMGINGEVVPFDAAQVEKRSLVARQEDVNTLDAAEASMGINGEVVPFDAAQVARKRSVTDRDEVEAVRAQVARSLAEASKRSPLMKQIRKRGLNLDLTALKARSAVTLSANKKRGFVPEDEGDC